MKNRTRRWETEGERYLEVAYTRAASVCVCMYVCVLAIPSENCEFFFFFGWKSKVGLEWVSCIEIHLSALCWSQSKHFE